MFGDEYPLACARYADRGDAIFAGIQCLQHVCCGHATDIVFGGLSTEEHDDVNAL